MNILYFVYMFIRQEAMGWFHFLVIMKNAVTSISVQFFAWPNVFISHIYIFGILLPNCLLVATFASFVLRNLFVGNTSLDFCFQT